MKKNSISDRIDGSICFFSHSSSLGGAERSLLDLIVILTAKGVKCSVVLPGDGPYKELCQNMGIQVKTFPLMAWWCNQDRFEEDFKQFLSTIQNNLYEIVEYIREISPTAIYTQTIVNPFGAIVAEYLNLPHFLALREYGELDHKLKFYFGFTESMKALYDTSDYVFSISKSVAKTVLKNHSLNANVKVNYSKVTLSSSCGQRDQKCMDDQVNIGVFGSINEGKNQADILKAVLILLEKGYDIQLYIVGYCEEEYCTYLTQLLSSSCYKHKIIFTGFVEKPVELMQKMDIVVSCSKSEGLGRTLIEAILLKVPIIYANSGGPQEIYVDTEHGLAYKLFDENDLVYKIIQVVRFPEETKQRIRKAYKYILEKFTDESYALPVIEALQEVNNKAPKRKENYLTTFIFSHLTIQSWMELSVPYIKLFINDGKGLSTANSIQYYVKRELESQLFLFDLSNMKIIKGLRLDLLNESCVIQIEKLLLRKQDGTEVDITQSIAINALHEINQIYYFDTNNPYISIGSNIESQLEDIECLVVQVKYLYYGNEALGECIKELKKEKEKLSISVLSKNCNDKIVFFGASSALEKVWSALQSHGIIPDYICDNDIKKHGEHFKGYTIFAPNEVFNKDERFIVLITSSYAKEIQNQLLCDYKSVNMIERMRIN